MALTQPQHHLAPITVEQKNVDEEIDHAQETEYYACQEADRVCEEAEHVLITVDAELDQIEERKRLKR